MRSALFFVAILCLPVLAAAGETRSGTAEVIDAERLRIGGQVYRLWGIDAPDPGQPCTRAGREFDCGHIAATALMDLVFMTRVSCVPVDPPRAEGDGAVPARCTAGGSDLSLNMLHTGWAMPDPALAPESFRRTAAEAEANGYGLWRFELGQAGEGELCVRGVYVAGGVECQAFEGEDGGLYTLLPRQPDSRPGDRACVCGTPAEVSICMQGTTLAEVRSGPLEDCP